ncbi:MAG: vWA domain-containing protein [Planctomycetota bacterium]
MSWIVLSIWLAGPAWRTYRPTALQGRLLVVPVPGATRDAALRAFESLRPALEAFREGDRLILESLGDGSEFELVGRSIEEQERAFLAALLREPSSGASLESVVSEIAADATVDATRSGRWIGLAGDRVGVEASLERLQRLGQSVRAVAVDVPVGPSQTLVRISPAAGVRAGEQLEAWLEVRSNRDGPFRGDVRLGDGEPVSFSGMAEALQTATVRAVVPTFEPGRQELIARLEGGPILTVTVEVSAEPRVLWWGRKDAPSLLTQLSEQRGWTLETTNSPSPVDRWDLVVLGEGAEPNGEQIAWLREQIFEGGTGLLVSGSEGDALRTLAASELGEWLPVTMLPPREPEAEEPEAKPEPEAEPQPDPEVLRPPPGAEPKSPERKERVADTVALAIVLDTSGSMAGHKIAAAKKAAWAAVDALDDGDRVAIITFSSDSTVVLPMTPVTQRTQIRLTLAQIGVGGETRFAPPLQNALETLSPDSAAVRHVIFLSDGQAFPEATKPIVEQMRARHITLSAVGLGREHNHDQLGSLASWGGGRYYFASVEDIPQIFLMDVERVVTDRLPPDEPPETEPEAEPEPEKEEPEPEPEPKPKEPELVPLELVHPEAITADLSDDSLPRLPGFERARSRADARTLIRTASGDEDLASIGAAGLGRVGVLANGLDGAWGNALSAWPDLGRFLGRFLTALLPSPRPEVAWSIGWYGSEAVIEVTTSKGRVAAFDEVQIAKGSPKGPKPLPTTVLDVGLFRAVLEGLAPGERCELIVTNVTREEDLDRKSWSVPEAAPRPVFEGGAELLHPGRPHRTHPEHRRDLTGSLVFLVLALGAWALWLQG